ncbi:hypothetical protein C823_007610 [Eubacterium plexicaudatum ASF492]|uniref:Uncharacterized protein n=1 Tax=Eubacterium plexicaudatum ASF492 TaxID=1235802 RepID=N2A5Q2_9FIRM|nr:hypothetical protein C823_007610 [Eubacterium plexicaudatum ASF492]
MKNIFELVHSVSTKQTLYFVKYITFILIVIVLLLEGNSVILYSALTYLAGIAFDTVANTKQMSEDVNNKLYIIENIIMVICILSVIAIVILKVSGHTNIPFGREILNAILIVTTPHPLIEGLIKCQESEGIK